MLDTAADRHWFCRLTYLASGFALVCTLSARAAIAAPAAPAAPADAGVPGIGAAGQGVSVWYRSSEGCPDGADFIELPASYSETSISLDGSVVLGSLSHSSQMHDPVDLNDSRTFRWTAGTGAVEIAPGVATTATDMSDDGNVIVATSYEPWINEGPPPPPRATYVWDSVHGTRTLTEILEARVVDVSGWKFGHARVLSGNGKVLFGRAWCGGVPTLYRAVLSD